MRFKLYSAIIALSVYPATALSQAQCAPRDLVIAGLAANYGETRQTVGMESRGGIVETYANTDTGSWTITVTTAEGIMCLIASGEAFERIDTPMGEEM